MSLHRVSSIETFHTLPAGLRSRRDSDASTRDRKLTFNPLPQAWDPPATLDHLHAVGAFTVPRWKRLLQVTASVVYCFFGAGVVFGYAALKPVLKAEGAYRDVCYITTTPAADQPDHDEDTCVEMHLNFMFTVAAVATNVAALPVGAILDHYGPRVCGLLASLFLTLGAALLAFEGRLPFDGLLLGYLFLALGGPFTYISSFQLSNAFPRHSGLILALMTGAFDASSAVFLAYRIVYNATDGAFSRRRFFMAYLLVPVAIVLLQLSLMPVQSYKTVGELVEEMETEEPLAAAAADATPYDQVDEETALLQEEERQHHVDVVEGIQEVLGSARADRQARQEEQKNKASGVWGVMHPYSAWEQIRSPWFVLICLFTVIQMTRINFFVATIRAQYESLFASHPGAAVALNNFFDVALPVGGILAIPFIGVLLDHTSTVAVLAALVVCATAIGALGIVRDALWAGYANVVLFVLFRPFYYTAVSDFCAKVFGFRTFGTVYGAIICLSGVLNLGQSGLDYLFQRAFAGDPVPVNLGLLVAGLVLGIGLVGFVGWKARRVRREVLEQEARGGGW